MTAKKLTRIALMSATLMVLQVGLSGLPNIEVVSICILTYTIVFGAEALIVAEVFGLLEILMWGFGLWNIMYFYVWAVLVLLTLLFRPLIKRFWWVSIPLNAFYGLAFGALCSLPYLAGGLASAITWWLNGLSFDAVHCAGNLFTAAILYCPLLRTFKYIRRYSNDGSVFFQRIRDSQT